MSLSSEEIEKLIKMVVDLSLPVKLVADLHGITASRVYQLVKSYRQNGVYPTPQKRGLPVVVVSSSVRLEIISSKSHLRLGTKALGKYLREIKGIPVGNRAIHRILLEEKMTKPEPQKGIRTRPWVHYEREFSLDAVHMDWHVSKYNGTMVCVVLDDASRMILAGGEFDAATTQNSILMLDFAYQRSLPYGKIREVITDHGSQFYANRRDCYGEANHAFEEYCKNMGIKHILCKYNHPQSNGKVERWFQIYKQFREEFASLEEMLVWYNTIRPHQSLDWDTMETPDKAFIRKLNHKQKENHQKTETENREDSA